MLRYEQNLYENEKYDSRRSSNTKNFREEMENYFKLILNENKKT